MDGDFAAYFHRTQRPNLVFIYLNLPNRLRTTPEINQLLATYLREHAEGVDL